jgi:hypothetical protein
MIGRGLSISFSCAPSSPQRSRRCWRRAKRGGRPARNADDFVAYFVAKYPEALF